MITRSFFIEIFIKSKNFNTYYKDIKYSAAFPKNISTGKKYLKNVIILKVEFEMQTFFTSYRYTWNNPVVWRIDKYLTMWKFVSLFSTIPRALTNSLENILHILYLHLIARLNKGTFSVKKYWRFYPEKFLYLSPLCIIMR